MAQDAKKEEKAKDTTKPAKVAAVRKPTYVEFLKARWFRGCKSRADCVALAIADAKAQGVTKNSKGRLMTPENGASLLNAMIRDVLYEDGKGRGAAHGGWWSLVRIEETETSFKLFKKA